MKIKSREELLVKQFVQRVSSATTFAKRYKSVVRLLQTSAPFSRQQWLLVWRGLYYSVWYSEMTKGCDRLIQTIGGHEDPLVLSTGFEALAKDWFGIDAFRLDKYMLLIRVMTNTCLKLQINALMNESTVDDSVDDMPTDCQTNDTKQTEDKDITAEDIAADKSDGKRKTNVSPKKSKNKRLEPKSNDIVFDIEFKAKLIDDMLSHIKPSIGLCLHVSDVIVDEMVKVLKQMKLNLKANQRMDIYYHLLLPFIKLMAIHDDYRVMNAVKQNVFFRLKNEILISESVDTRKDIMNRLMAAMTSIGGVEAVRRKNRDSLYDLITVYKKKVNQLMATNIDSRGLRGLKRKKILIGKGRHKKVKYEVTASSPFIRSIVPIAVV